MIFCAQFLSPNYSDTSSHTLLMLSIFRSRLFWHTKFICFQNHKQSSNCHKIYTLYTAQITWLSQLIYVRLAYSICTSLILWSNLRYRKRLPPYSTFHQSRMILILSSSCDMHRINTVCYTTGNNSSSISFYILCVAYIYYTTP